MIELLLSVVISYQPIKVLVIDTGTARLPSIESNTIPNQRWTSSDGHGTIITYMIINGSGLHDRKVSSNVIVEVCDINYDNLSVGSYEGCLTKMVSGGYDFINISLNGPVYNKLEESLIKQASGNSRIIVAAGNNKENLEKVKSYPASYKSGGYVRAVSALNENNILLPSSNYGKNVAFFKGIGIARTINGSLVQTQGTSIAAALYTHNLILQLEKERREFAK